jgi:hypothetical protein
MTKNYLNSIIVSFLFSFAFINAQDLQQPNAQVQHAEQLSFYPNPITDGKLYISSKNLSSRDITVYDVLGKVVFKTTTQSKEINLQVIQPGIYMIRIKEGEQVSTKKLIIK